MNHLTSPALPGQAIRFVLVGGINTLATGAIFYGLSLLVAPAVAYTLSFALGVVFVVLVTPRFVFLARVAQRQRIVYGLWYVVVYLIGLAVVEVADGQLRLARPAVVVATLGTTATLSFAGGRLLFGRTQAGERTQ